MSSDTESNTHGPTEDELWDSYNNLLVSSDVERVRKLLVRYDLYRLAEDVPGDILECGVFKGVGLFFWLKLLHVLEPGSRKKVIGFDTFGSFADSLLDYEKKSASQFTDEAAFEGTDPAELMRIAKAGGFDHRLELVAGDIKTSAAQYVEENKGFRISLLHLDLDTYIGTKAALEAFYPMVSRGGVIIFDEYADRGWGESDATDEFFADKNVKLQVVKNSNKPTAYAVKP